MDKKGWVLGVGEKTKNEKYEEGGTRFEGHLLSIEGEGSGELYDRDLLSDLSRCAWESLKLFRYSLFDSQVL
jgi:hypothetical protein